MPEVGKVTDYKKYNVGWRIDKDLLTQAVKDHGLNWFKIK
jgi:hypothetical protein